ncbi:MAG: reverse transcriptase/maturase family protein [Candidatus Margulisiibacteriota bacterium]
MKNIRNIYSQIISKENLYQSAYMAAKGRRYRDTTADFYFNLENEINLLYEELVSKTYRHGKYRQFTIYEPKKRMIAAAPFRDRVVHHAVHDIIEPIIDKSFIYHSYACRKNKGTHKAVDKAQSFLRANEFCFHGDIKKYFPSIDHDILKKILRRRIEDEDLLWLLDEIINSAARIVASDEWRDFTHHSPLTTRHSNGLPIGNLTSQFFANLYLNELDYFIKFDLRERYYLRYMDDFLIFSNDKQKLLDIKKQINSFLKETLSLTMHERKSQIYKTTHGIKFLGFRLFKTHRRLASDNVRRFRKRLKIFIYLFENGLMDIDEIRDSVRCWVAHSKYADTNKLRFNILKDCSSNITNTKVDIGYLLEDVLLENI